MLAHQTNVGFVDHDSDSVLGCGFVSGALQWQMVIARFSEGNSQEAVPGSSAACWQLRRIDVVCGGWPRHCGCCLLSSPFCPLSCVPIQVWDAVDLRFSVSFPFLGKAAESRRKLFAINSVARFGHLQWQWPLPICSLETRSRVWAVY